MAYANSIKNEVPVIEIKGMHGSDVVLSSPNESSLGEGSYCLHYSGEDWTGEFKDGDLLFIDPNKEPLSGDYAAVWIPGHKDPCIELLAFSLLPDSIGKPVHPDSNARPIAAFMRNEESFVSIDASKISAIHKVVGKGRLQ